MEYEGLNLICFLCGKAGHRKDSCPIVVPVTTEDLNAPVSEQKTVNSMGEDDATYGPWILVQPRSRMTNRVADDKGKKQSPVSHGHNGNLFSIFGSSYVFHDNTDSGAPSFSK